tara:strand:+ start:98 stop:706 length:609 start_codon:yes stop_codon:yes gene_type:complete
MKKYLFIVLFVGVCFGHSSETVDLKNDNTKSFFKFSFIKKETISFEKTTLNFRNEKRKISYSINSKLKLLTEDGNTFIGKYKGISKDKEFVSIYGINKKNLSIDKHIVNLKKILEIEKGIGNSIFKRGFKYGTLCGGSCYLFSSLSLFMQHGDDPWILPISLAMAFSGSIPGAIGGAIYGYHYPKKFEDKILINEDAWILDE